MAPAGIRRRIVGERAAWVREVLGAMARLRLDDHASFVSDPRNQAAAESYLRRALEALLDLGRHILAKGFAVGSNEYSEIPRRLAEVGLLTPTDAETMIKMARYRNRLTHFYHEVTTQELYDICSRQLGDVERILDALLKWVEAHPEKVDRSL